MKTWWYNLAPRERLWVIIGSIAIVLTVTWFYGVKPLLAYKQTLIQVQEDTLADQKQLAIIAPQVQAATATQTTPDPTRNEKLQYILDPLLKRYTLDQPEILISQSENANGSVSLRLQKAPFDQLIAMLGALELHHQAYAVQFTITPTQTTGLVNASLTLMR